MRRRRRVPCHRHKTKPRTFLYAPRPVPLPCLIRPRRVQDQICCFNDDIQGTACITLAGILAALRVTGRPLSEQVILFYGAGEAGTGIGELIALALHKHHRMPMAEARRRCFFMDSQGLVCASRQKLQVLWRRGCGASIGDRSCWASG